ncbi:hypothetical protein GW17_00058412, partial [Ensete ventricosum]
MNPEVATVSLITSHCGFSLLLPVIAAKQPLLCYAIGSLPVLISRVELLCPLPSTFPERVDRVVAVTRRTLALLLLPSHAKDDVSATDATFLQYTPPPQLLFNRSIMFYSSWQSSTLIHLWHRLSPLLRRLQSHRIQLQSICGIASAPAAQAVVAAAGRETGSLKVRHY